MNKKLLFVITAGALAAAANLMAAPIVTYIKTIDVDAAVDFPVDIAEYQGNLFISSFTNQDIVKVADPLGATPVVTQFKDLTSEFTWESGRGPQGIHVDQSNGDIYSFGDAGATSLGALIVLSQAGATLDKEASTAQRLISGVVLGPDNLLVVYVASSTVRTVEIDPTYTTVTTSGAFAAPYNSNIRDIVRDGNRFYYTRNGTTADAVGYFDLNGTGDVASVTSTGLIQLSGVNAVAAFGLDIYTDGIDKWVVVPDITEKTVKFVDVTDASVDLTLDPNNTVADDGTFNSLRSLNVATIAGITYLFVTVATSATPTTTDSIVVYQLGAASVNDWAMY